MVGFGVDARRMSEGWGSVIGEVLLLCWLICEECSVMLNRGDIIIISRFMFCVRKTNELQISFAVAAQFRFRQELF